MYRCPKCSKGYRHNRNRQRHIRYECGKEPSFICSVPGCNYRAKQKTHLTSHYSHVHIRRYNQIYSNNIH